MNDITYKNFYVNNSKLRLFCESYGKGFNPCILLIQGNSAQGLLWRDEFCIKLSNRGFYVLRYDHRDTGLSSEIDFEKEPYTLEDLSKDALNILDFLNIKKAHIIGASMGGYIAQIIGCNYPERTLSVTSMMSSLYSLTMDLAFSEDLKIDLPFLSNAFLDSLSLMKPITDKKESQIEHLLTLWTIYNGGESPFNIETYQKMAKNWIDKKPIKPLSPHSMAVKNSLFDRSDSLSKIKVPYLIIHGEKDPFFPIEHALKQHELVKDSTLFIVEKMGHLLHEAFDKKIINTLIKFYQEH